MKQSTQNWLLALGAGVAAFWLWKKHSSLKGLGDADPDKLDISKESDLCDSVSNLIAAEQHLVSSAAKTGDTKYVDALNKVREMRRSMMAKLLPENAQGETWCLTKHLLAGSMHAREVGDKYAAGGQTDVAQQFYTQSQELKNSALALAATAKPGGQCAACRGG